MDRDQQTKAIFDVIMEYTEAPEHDKKMGDFLRDTRATWPGDPDKVLQSLVGVLYDGLTYGNWPWSPTTVDGILRPATIRKARVKS